MRLFTTRYAAVFLLAFAPFTLAQTPQQQDHAQDHMAEAMPAKPPVPPSKALTVSFDGKSITLSVEDLINLPQVTVKVHNEHRNADESYTGPLLSDVLAKPGLVASRETQSLILHSNVVATGTDHYFVLYSAAEVEPSFSTGKVIVAVMKAGLPNTEGGNIQLINTVDAKPARWVHGLMSVNVMSLSPTKQ
jgi:hypothetical protein